MGNPYMIPQILNGLGGTNHSTQGGVHVPALPLTAGIFFFFFETEWGISLALYLNFSTFEIGIVESI